MNIRGIYKTSLIDYPGKICTVLFSGGCNLRCGFCHNRELVRNSPDLPLTSNEAAIGFLRKRKGIIDGVTLSGGEPTLSNRIVPFVREIKKLGLLVKLDTNGLNGEVVEELLDNHLLDYIALDIKTSPDKYAELSGSTIDFARIERTVEYIKRNGIEYELRTTCVPAYSTIDDFAAIKDAVGQVKRYFLQQFMFHVPLLRDSFQALRPYTVNQLLELKAFVASFADDCEIRGI